MTGADSRTRPATVQHWRSIILREPDAGLNQLHRHLTQHAQLTHDLVYLWILLAETAQRLGRWREALHALDSAAERELSNALPGRHRLLRAVGVGADIAICTADADSLQACTNYFTELQQSHDSELADIAVSGCLRAVAAYQRLSCADGLRQLRILQAVLQKEPTGHAILLDSIDAGITAMNNGCLIGCVPAPATALPPLPGAVLAPDLTRPDPRWLAFRVELHPPTHTCPLGPAPEAGQPC
jgi:hypothetical protein